ncbi:phage tail protein (plasmid) [Rhizobium bangladeshense]|uniref:phage tail protein n=1 Tax=Rhizobium TaxID=379 RepID=UPI0007E5470E|nr:MULTISPECIES: tail fiber protein [Rhizobium]MBX4869965.1 phage tail protein [Rhizobium bangladeshense]MBX4904835.1 phage tail protein [Rhizobium bangladeshense]MBX4935727.1 phage tail protein [Rhizobium bangladeshense]MBY3584640.1 phage tail protein [Rhizobium bangladeshense]MBY3614461.1 phage tail protein [Rhizobium bangladeshense]
MSTPFVGEIRLFGFSRVPSGWLPCNNSLQPISEYENLFTLIGTTYGGDGETTFATPNLCGRVPVHQGSGPNLSTYVIGQFAGSENVTLLPTQMPAHTHPYLATTGLAEATLVSSSELAALSGDTMYATDISGATPITASQAAIQATGSTVMHDNTMPTLTVQYCIAWAGIFPSSP